VARPQLDSTRIHCLQTFLQLQQCGGVLMLRTGRIPHGHTKINVPSPNWMGTLATTQ
jgi:hypothetical protein